MPDTDPIFERTVKKRRVSLVSFFSGILTSLFERSPLLRGALTSDDKPIEVQCRDLLSSRGEVSGMSLAQIILDRYANFDDEKKLE